MRSFHVIGLVALARHVVGQTDGGLPPTYGTDPNQGNQGNQEIPSSPEAILANSLPCQNARDASVAGTAIAHQLLSVASQMAPPSNAALVDGIQQAQIALAKAQIFVGNLAMSTASLVPAQAADVQQLSYSIQDVLKQVKSVQTAAKQNNGNSNIGLNMTEQMDPIVTQIALITANGPMVVNNQLANTLISPAESFLAQASLQLQTVLQALFFSQSCTVESSIPNGNSTAPPLPPLPPFVNSTIPQINSTIPQINSTIPQVNSTEPNTNTTITLPPFNSTQPQDNLPVELPPVDPTPSQPPVSLPPSPSPKPVTLPKLPSYGGGFPGFWFPLGKYGGRRFS